MYPRPFCTPASLGFATLTTALSEQLCKAVGKHHLQLRDMEEGGELDEQLACVVVLATAVPYAAKPPARRALAPSSMM